MSLLDRGDLAERFKVHETTIWRWVRSGTLPPGILIADGTVRWDAEELQAWIAAKPRGVLRPRGGRQ